MNSLNPASIRHLEKFFTLPSAASVTESAQLPSVAAFKKYGVRKSVVAWATTHAFKLDPCIRHCFQVAYLLNWRSDWLAIRLEETPGFLEHTGVIYQVIFCRTKSNALQKEKVWLSFRKPQPEFGLPATVLIS
jgi:hypothetical protein